MPHLEGKMLKEVGSSVSFICFGSRTGIDPDTDSRGLSPGRVFCSDLYFHELDVVVRNRFSMLTVKPLERVVLSVLIE